MSETISTGGTVSVNGVLSFPCPKCKATAGNYCTEPGSAPDRYAQLPPDRQHIERQKLATENASSLIARGEPRASQLDPINPSHYKGDLVMRIIEHFGLNEDYPLGNVIKYILRHKSKAGLEDLKKARWYLDRKIAQLEGTLKGGLS